MHLKWLSAWVLMVKHIDNLQNLEMMTFDKMLYVIVLMCLEHILLLQYLEWDIELIDIIYVLDLCIVHFFCFICSVSYLCSGSH